MSGPVPRGGWHIPANCVVPAALWMKSTPRKTPCLNPCPALLNALRRPRGGVVTQRTANPCTPVRFRPRPPDTPSYRCKDRSALMTRRDERLSDAASGIGGLSLRQSPPSTITLALLQPGRSCARLARPTPPLIRAVVSTLAVGVFWRWGVCARRGVSEGELVGQRLRRPAVCRPRRPGLSGETASIGPWPVAASRRPG